MNELTKAIFKELDLVPDEEFKIKEFSHNDIYKITEDLKLMIKNHKGNYFFVSSQNLGDLITGRLTIQKIKKPTEDDLAVLKYVKICGYKYVAQDENGDIFMYSQRPYKYNAYDETSYFYNKWTNDDKDYLQLHAPISFISWDDEPTCIDDYI